MSFDFVPLQTDHEAQEVYKANCCDIQTDKTMACAKFITAEGREFYVSDSVTEVLLGREKKDGDPAYFQIGESNTISKQHAKVFWDAQDRCFKIQNLSKNKVSLLKR